ncbi:Phospho-N-acetylmuramoyl-pentapeptide-transferase [bacterium HR16]|nr:Phospho-N-acetylmuramoyl-pentapeptide-transferase [bacterium HR16]
MDARVIAIVLFVSAPFVVLLGCIALFPKLCRRWGWLKRNYRGVVVPCGYGVIWWAFCTVLYAELAWMSAPETRSLSLAFLVSAFGFGLLGWIDDLWGDPASKGLRGHLRALRQGRITTGLMKAVGGLAVSLIAAWLLQGGWATLPGGLVIALMANAMNLLDMRPGRAVSVFLALSVVVVFYLLFSGQALTAAMLGFLMAAALLLRRHDASGEAMMGDVGSNLLGGVLGVSLVAGLPLWAQVVVLALLVALHIAAERVSLSRWIEDTPWARRLDRLTGVR